MVLGEWIHPGKQEFLPELLKKENSTISFTDNRNEK